MCWKRKSRTSATSLVLGGTGLVSLAFIPGFVKSDYRVVEVVQPLSIKDDDAWVARQRRVFAGPESLIWRAADERGRLDSNLPRPPPTLLSVPSSPDDEPLLVLAPSVGNADISAESSDAHLAASVASPEIPVPWGTGEVTTPTTRRDPIEPPLLEEEIWQEWLLAVTLNGEPFSDATLFVQNPEDQSFAISADALDQWRVRYDLADVLTFQGNPYLPLDKLRDAQAEVDLATLTLDLTVAPGGFYGTVVDLDEQDRVVAQSGLGGFFDYDLLFSAGSELDTELSGLFELGGFGSLGHGITNFRVEAMDEDPELIRLESFLRHDFLDKRATLRIGDTISEGGSFASGTRFGGIQYGTNFATDPSFVTFPRPSIGGLAEQSSVVDVIIDDATRATENVPPGPFSIGNLPVVTGAGEVQLRVTDLLGREQIVTQPYYVSSRLLRDGLHEYAYGVGFERKDFGSESFDYGDPIANVTHRYGFSDWITGEAHIESKIDRQSLVVGGSALIGAYGVVSGAVGASQDEGEPGALGELAYEYLAGDWNLSLRTRYTSDDFRQFGDTGQVRRTDQANLGFQLGDWGRIGLLLVNRDRVNADNDRLFTATYSVPVGPGSLLLNGVQTFEPDNELAFTATYSIPLGPRRSMSASFARRDRDNIASAQYRRTRGASDLGLDYRLAAEVGDDDARGNGRASYQSRYGTGNVEFERFQGENNFRAGISGSLALVDGVVRPSRRIGQAFGIVSMAGFSDVKVLVDNREVGRTDSKGALVLPRLRAYEANRISFDVEDLPLDARVGYNEVTAAPMDRSGIMVDFNIERSWQATATLVDQEGAFLPSGLHLVNESGTVEAMVARDGFTQITGTIFGAFELISSGESLAYRCEIMVAEDESFADLGGVTCASH